MKTNVYVDGFNLYFGAAKRFHCKWLNPLEVARRHLGNQNQIQSVKVFTARVNPRPHDPGQPLRQQTYLRALGTVPEIEIFYGHFLTKETRMPDARSRRVPPQMLDVIKTEEKGSDVNLASQLLRDAYTGAFECAVLITGDSDLLMPVRIVKEELGFPVGVLNPQQNPCQVLRQHATFYKHLKKQRVLASAFPATLTDANGSFSKPSVWA